MLLTLPSKERITKLRNKLECRLIPNKYTNTLRYIFHYQNNDYLVPYLIRISNIHYHFVIYHLCDVISKLFLEISNKNLSVHTN